MQRGVAGFTAVRRTKETVRTLDALAQLDYEIATLAKLRGEFLRLDDRHGCLLEMRRRLLHAVEQCGVLIEAEES